MTLAEAASWAQIGQAAAAFLALFALALPWMVKRLRPSLRDRARRFIKLSKVYPRPKAKLLKITRKMRDATVLDAEDLDELDEDIRNFPDILDGESYSFNRGNTVVMGSMAQRDFRQKAYFALNEFIDVNDF